MELKDIKYIRNTGNLPKFADGFISPWDMILGNGGFNSLARRAISQGGVDDLPTESWLLPFSNTPKTGNKSVQTFDMSKGGDVVSTGINFVKSGIDSFTDNTTESDLAAKYGTSNGYVDGIGYTKQNLADVNKERAEIRRQNFNNTLSSVGSGAAFGAAAGSIVPGLGTVFGGLIGAGLGGLIGGIGSAERARKHSQLVARFNDNMWNTQQESRGGALTKALRLNNSKQYGNPEQQYLFGAKNGKLAKFSDGKIWTPYGPVPKNSGIEPNGMVSNGETLYDAETGARITVPGKPNNKDTQYAFLGPNMEYGVARNGLASMAAAQGDFATAEYMMNTNTDRLFKAKNGKMPRFYEGWVPNVITSGLGMLVGLGLYLDASGLEVKKPNSYVANPYELEGLNTLAGLRVNPYPIMQQQRAAESRINRAIDRSGGLSTAQRYLSRLAGLNTTQRNIADALAGIQTTNNSYFSNYAKTALEAGAKDALMAMAANQHDLNYYSKAHAARQQGMQMGIYNMLNNLQQYYANDFKRRQFNDTMKLYRDDQLITRDEIQALLNGSNRSDNTKPAYIPRFTYVKPGMSYTPKKATGVKTPSYIPSGRNPWDTYTSWKLKRGGII